MAAAVAAASNTGGGGGGVGGQNANGPFTRNGGTGGFGGGGGGGALTAGPVMAARAVSAVAAAASGQPAMSWGRAVSAAAAAAAAPAAAVAPASAASVPVPVGWAVPPTVVAVAADSARVALFSCSKTAPSRSPARSMPTATASPAGARRHRQGSGAGTAGSALGSGLFLQGSGTVTFSPGSGQTQTVSDVIADQTGSGGTGVNAGNWALSKTGAGTLVLGATNTYSGGTNVTGGGDVSVSLGRQSRQWRHGCLGGWHRHPDFTAGGTYSHSITVAGDPTFDVATGQTVTQGAVRSPTAPTPGEVEKTGAGTLILGPAAHTYTGGTPLVSAGTLQPRHGRQPGSNRGPHRQWRHLQSQ